MSIPPGHNYFTRYPNPVFVETGAFRGDGIQLALDAGFRRIVSIEIDPAWAEYCRIRFGPVATPITIVEGDSLTVLGEVIRPITEPITFWLDAHWMYLRDSAQGAKVCPLLEELAHIAAHSLKTHTILIDDMRVWHQDDPLVGFGRADIEAAVRAINPAYAIRYLDNPVVDDILVAVPR